MTESNARAGAMGDEREFERALAEGCVASAALLAVRLARGRRRGVGPSTVRLERVLAAGGLEPAARIEVVRELAVLHSRAGRYGAAFEAMALALALAQEADRQGEVSDAERGGAFFAVQVASLPDAHRLLDNAESSAARLGDETRLGLARVVRGVAFLAEGRHGEAVELIADGIARAGAAAAEELSFAQRQLARALARAGRRRCAVEPLAAALASAIERGDDPQLAECLETFAAVDPGETAARALGAACALRARSASQRWADEGGETEATIASVRGLLGFDRTTDLAAEGLGTPDAVAQHALAALAA